MPLDPITIALPGGDTPLPRMLPIEQRFPADSVGDVKAAVAAALAALPKRPEVAGKLIGITAVSRGIRMGRALQGVIEPSCVGRTPSSSRHGQPRRRPAEATRNGRNTASPSSPVRAILSSMEWSSRATRRHPLYCDRKRMPPTASSCSRSSRHPTTVRLRSGLCKMMIIGMGKHHGATVFHSLGFARFAEMMPKAAAEQLKVLPVVFGLGLVENAYDGLAVIEAIAPEKIVAREKELLVTAKAVMGKLLMSAIDVLVVDEVGKNISGTGMDPTVTGRAASKLPGFVAPPITRVALLDITEESHGNATGMGVADMITMRMFNKIDLGDTYTNTITSRNTDPPASR